MTRKAGMTKPARRTRRNPRAAGSFHSHRSKKRKNRPRGRIWGRPGFGRGVPVPAGGGRGGNMAVQETYASPSEAIPEEQATDFAHELISSRRVEGTAVYSESGEKLGTIHSVMIGKRSGQVAYAVL